MERAVVSSSNNGLEVLVAAGIEDLFEQGKSAPATFLAGARALGVAAAQAAVFEDALAGVAARRNGGFACAVGVDRVGQAGVLREHAAHIVVSDLAEFLDT
jgi:HAD superfamily hydrolase (TIGR01509 family)